MERKEGHMKIENKPVIAKATNTPGHIVSCRMNRLCLHVGFHHDVYIPLTDYRELLIVDEELGRELDRRIERLRKREERLALPE